MEDKLLTMADVARRWQVHHTTIRNWVNDGKIQTIKGIPSPRFSLEYIQRIEEVKPDRFSPLERKRLELEIERLKQENEKLKEVARVVFQQTSQVMGL